MAQSRNSNDSFSYIASGTTGTPNLLLSGVGLAFGWPPAVATIGAMGFVLSSTAVIMKMLDERGVTASPAQIIEPFVTMSPLWLPTINTALLLSSGVTITIAHHAIRENDRSKNHLVHVDDRALWRRLLDLARL